MGEWLQKVAHNGILFIFLKKERKKEILSFVTTWMNLEGIMQSDVRQTEKGKYHMASLI